MPDGEPVSFGGIRRIWVELEPAYTPQPFPPASSDYFVRLELAVARDEEARWLDCSFLIDSSDTVLDLPTYTVSTPASLTQLGAVLNQNKLYYSQQIWLREDPQARIMQLAPFQLKFGDSVVNLVDHLPPQPLQVVGNYLVYRFTYEEDEEWTTWTSQNVDRSRVTVDTVAVPTGGVFGEAVLGRANAAEKLDITRFFDWQDSPPPAPPQIQALMAGTHTPAQAPDLPTFDKPLVSIQSPVALPDPVTLSSVLGAVTTNGAFRNMSGASATRGRGQPGARRVGQGGDGVLERLGAGARDRAECLRRRPVGEAGGGEVDVGRGRRRQQEGRRGQEGHQGRRRGRRHRCRYGHHGRRRRRGRRTRVTRGQVTPRPATASWAASPRSQPRPARRARRFRHATAAATAAGTAAGRGPRGSGRRSRRSSGRRSPIRAS